MTRRPFNLAAAVSLGMMLAVVVVWIWTYHIGRGVFVSGSSSVNGPYDAISINADRGWLRVTRLYVGGEEHPEHGITAHVESYWSEPSPHFAVYRSGMRELPTGWWSVGVQFWLLLLVVSVPPCAWFVHVHSAAAERHHGICARCGYDLRATLDRCPECGTAVSWG